MEFMGLITYEGTIASEGVLCSSCYLLTKNTQYAKEIASQAGDVDIKKSFVDCSGNESNSCIICGTSHK